MKPKPGSLYVLEGPDKAGKTTLAARFSQVLEAKDRDVLLYSFPGQETGTIGNLVYRVHHNPKELGITESIDPASLQILHVAAHVDAIDRAIRPAIKAGSDVVLDRYWWSTWVYGRLGSVSENLLRAMLKIEELRWGDLLPRMIFLIRRSSLNNGPDPKIVMCYEELIREETISSPEIPIIEIDNDRSIEEALGDMLAALERVENE